MRQVMLDGPNKDQWITLYKNSKIKRQSLVQMEFYWALLVRAHQQS